MTKTCLAIAFCINVLLFIAWLIGYPLYNRIARKALFEYGYEYSMGLLLLACGLNVINLIIHLIP